MKGRCASPARPPSVAAPVSGREAGLRPPESAPYRVALVAAFPRLGGSETPTRLVARPALLPHVCEPKPIGTPARDRLLNVEHRERDCESSTPSHPHRRGCG